MVRPGPPPPGARRVELDRMDRAASQIASCRPRLPADLGQQLEDAALAARREGELLAAEIDELRSLVAGLDPQRATAELKEAERARAAAGQGGPPLLDAAVESARQRYVAVHTAWNAMEDAERELGQLALRAEEAAARATALTVERRTTPTAGDELTHVTDRIEALRRARAELADLDRTNPR